MSVHLATNLLREVYRIPLRKKLFKLITLQPCDTCARIVKSVSDSLCWRCVEHIRVQTRFSATLQTSPGTHPVSYTKGTGSFSGVKRPGRGVDRPPSSSSEVKETVGL